MAPSPLCKAVAAAKEKKEMSYKDIADKIGQSEQHVIDICAGTKTPTKEEFASLARALDITNPPHDTAHTTI